MTENRNIAPAVATPLVFLRAVICGTLLIALVSEAGLAQATTTLWENLQQVKVGQNVSVARRNSSVTKGKFHHFSQDGISLEIKKQLIEIRRDDVLRVELRKGRGRHIAIGAAIGAALGIAVNARGSTEGNWTAIFIPIGAGAGAGVGALLPASHSIVYEHPCISQGNCGERSTSPRNNADGSASKRPFQSNTPAAAPDERRYMNTAERRLRKRPVDGLAGPDHCIDTDTDRGTNPGVYGDGCCDFRSIPAAPSVFTESDSAQGAYASTYGSADQCAIRQRIRSTLFDFDGVALPEFANAAAGFQTERFSREALNLSLCRPSLHVDHDNGISGFDEHL